MTTDTSVGFFQSISFFFWTDRMDQGDFLSFFGPSKKKRIEWIESWIRSGPLIPFGKDVRLFFLADRMISERGETTWWRPTGRRGDPSEVMCEGRQNGNAGDGHL